MKKKLMLMLLIICMFAMLACAGKLNGTRFDKNVAVDYVGDLKFQITNDYVGEKIIILPLHLYYDKGNDAVQLLSNSSHTVNSIEGKSIELDYVLEGKPSSQKSRVKEEIQWTSLVQNPEKKSNGSLKFEYKILSITQDNIKVEYSLDGEKGKEIIEFKRKVAKK